MKRPHTAIAIHTILLVLCTFMVAIGLRFWQLDRPDLNYDELHYASDAYRWISHDSSISLRDHPMSHPSPNMAHPFGSLTLTSFAFLINGTSVFTARVIPALCGICLLIVLLFFNGKLKAVTIPVMIIYALLPLTVRYNRAAYLDSFFALAITVSVLGIWKFAHNKSKWIWGAITGAALGLAVSTKIDGLMAVIIDLGLFFVIRRRHEKTSGNIFLLVFICTAAVVSLLLNNPAAYAFGILHPSDPNAHLFALDAIKRLLRFPIENAPIAWGLLSPGITIACIIALWRLCKQKTMTDRFLLVWFIGTFGIALVQEMGKSGEWGWLPMIPPLLFIIMRMIATLQTRQRWIITAALLLSMLPYTYMYGLYLSPLPFRKSVEFNETQQDIFYQSVIKTTNALTAREEKVFFDTTEQIPLFMLRSDINRVHIRQTADILITTTPQTPSADVIHITTLQAFQDGQIVTRYIYRQSH